jgi:peroxiredoxin/uncharacterized membrane protein YphA (DoxX/SURF4 family)
VEVGLVVARQVLSLAFAVAGVAKLADRAGSRQALADFGLPGVLVGPMAFLLPAAELGVAAALLPAATARWGAVGALILLVAFMGAIGVNLARGRRPDCHCFGQLDSRPIGWPTLARNAVLAAAAGLVAFGGPQNVGVDAWGWIGDLTAAQLLVIAGATGVILLMATEGWLLLNLVRQQGRLLIRIDRLEETLKNEGPRTQAAQMPSEAVLGLPVGSQAPAFELHDINGEALTLRSLTERGKPLMLLFTDPGCGPCLALLPEVAAWQRDHANKLTIALISSGKVKDNRARAREQGLTQVLIQDNREVAEAYQYRGTPSAVIVTPDGRVATPLVAGAEAIRSLFRERIEAPSRALPVLSSHNTRDGANGSQNGALEQHRHTRSPGIPVGQPAPSVSLPDLDGKIVALTDLRGQDVVLLFWNLGCGYCQQMLPDLKIWESSVPQGTPKLLVVSSGRPEDNRTMGLRSPVLLDDEGRTMAFGAHGTPMAVLVDQEGRVGSPVAAGATAVLSLLRGEYERTVRS